MRIEIRKDGNSTAVLISFDMDCSKFGSSYERNKFFRGLYGWEQVIKKNNSVYHYHREGVMNEVPHIKVDNSVFIVAMEEMQRVLDYFDGWENKVHWKTFQVLLTPDEVRLLEKKANESDLSEE
ncbi:MAG: hypothetical protein HY516_03320 [Candidatus Aenigmarchaeota archaeon]|nr:hypothetical protein [Candidatus Aenigmarchaeota archaeon]